MNYLIANISYKKSFIVDIESHSTIRLVRYKENLYVNNRTVEKPTANEIFKQSYIPKIYRVNNDNSVSVGTLVLKDNKYQFKQSPYYDN